MSWTNFLKRDSGNALIEFVLYGLVLQVLVLTFGVQVMSTQAQQLAAESAARHALRSYVLSGVDPAISAIAIVKDFGLVSKVEVQLTCNPDCESQGSILNLKVQVGEVKSNALAVR